MRRLAVLGLLLVLVACGKPIKAGAVVKKDFTPAHTYTWFMPITTGKTVVMVPETGFVPDTWTVTIKNCLEKCRTRDVDVPHTTYDKLQINDTYTVPD